MENGIRRARAVSTASLLEQLATRSADAALDDELDEGHALDELWSSRRVPSGDRSAQPPSSQARPPLR